ncbi:hypothetical protein [Herbidospora mongoliensis]|uniref:hypothetical protein n=1 Tax=Herbidospora mongoliensis TaxID=688067 RepID=UPI000ADA863D|nr:hypothetical protein [Herbidospora mongoliensis]
MYDEVVAGRPPAYKESHPDQMWAPVGGRVSTRRVRGLIDAVTTLARENGFPETAGIDARISFDRHAAKVIRGHLDLSWAEAGNRDLWSFLSLVALPHVTMWRFGPDNKERWIATDLTRHTWARLWWQAVVFAGHEHVLAALNESDLNQLLERRSIGGDPRLTRELARAVIELGAEAPRRAVIRDVTARLRRYLAFLDVRALSDQQVKDLCLALTGETVTRLQGDGAGLQKNVASD